jgi:outer membrane protein assembly factor BamD (BamD/ComL family)
MRANTLRQIIISSLLLFFLTQPLFAQSKESPASDFNEALDSYVMQLLSGFGKDAIKRERFLVTQIRLLNDEIKARVKNIEGKREGYFAKLENQKTEIEELRQRLSGSGSQKLNQFIDQVEQKIDQAIASGIIDFKKKRVIENAVQLLHIAEEMIQLDPNSNLDANKRIEKGIQKSKSDFIASFEETSFEASKEKADANKTVFDVYHEWKQKERMKFQIRWADVENLKNELLKESNSTQRLSMFHRESIQAAEMFNFGYYDLAERMFEEIYKRYGFYASLDDILYYKGEANYFLGRYTAAKNDFEKMTQNYPTSNMAGSAYKRLIQISNHFNDFSSALNYLEQLRVVASTELPELEEAIFITLLLSKRNKKHNESIRLALDIDPTSILYNSSSLILAEAYAGARNYDEAVNILTDLADKTEISPSFRFKILLKLGYVLYEQGAYQDAIHYFDQIAVAYENYDRVLIGYAWASYQLELKKTSSDKKDFSFTIQKLEALLSLFLGSDYYLEAKTLLGYVNQLQERENEAFDNYEYVYHTKKIKKMSDDMNNERDKIIKDLSLTNKLEKKALKLNDETAYIQAKNIKQKLNSLHRSATYSNVKESLIENENRKILAMRDEAQKNLMEITNEIEQLEADIQNAKDRGDYENTIRLMLSRESFVGIQKKMDFTNAQAYSFDVRESYSDLTRWSDYGAFGMANVNFSIRQKKAKQISYMHEQIGAINDFFEKRKQNIEHKIKQIEDEITLMTRQVHRQERMREREEMERQFKESYFDTHDTELEYDLDTTELPQLEGSSQQEEEEF